MEGYDPTTRLQGMRGESSIDYYMHMDLEPRRETCKVGHLENSGVWS